MGIHCRGTAGSMDRRWWRECPFRFENCSMDTFHRQLSFPFLVFYPYPLDLLLRVAWQLPSQAGLIVDCMARRCWSITNAHSDCWCLFPLRKDHYQRVVRHRLLSTEIPAAPAASLETISLDFHCFSQYFQMFPSFEMSRQGGGLHCWDCWCRWFDC